MRLPCSPVAGTPCASRRDAIAAGVMEWHRVAQGWVYPVDPTAHPRFAFPVQTWPFCPFCGRALAPPGGRPLTDAETTTVLDALRQADGEGEE